MPKSGKGQKNGLTFYILTELIPELTRQGQAHPQGFKALVPIALPRYQALPRHEKEKYERMAKAERANKSPAEAASDMRRDNLGQFIAERVDTREQMRTKRSQDRRELQTLFASSTEAEILEQKFYFIDFQYMILTEENIYYPLEYGLVEWCMMSGITRSEHGFINPGPIPLGYRYKAKEHSEDTHKIPLEEFSEGESNYQKIWMKFERFLCSDLTDNKFPPVYCLDLNYAKVNGCLSWLYENCGTPFRNHLHLNILEELTTVFFAHKNFTISESSVMDLLTTSAYDFEDNTKCKKHDEVEAKHCALGCVKKYTFALLDALADDYGFSLTSNHLPTIAVGLVSRSATDNMRPSDTGFGSGMGARGSSDKSGAGASFDKFGAGAGASSDKFGARDIRYFPSTKESCFVQKQEAEAEDEYDDDDEDDIDHYEDRRNNSQAAGRFANFNGKAPDPSSVPNPSAFLPSTNRMESSTMEQMRNMTVQSSSKTVPTLAGIASDFRGRYESAPENKTRRELDDLTPYLGSIGAISNTTSPLLPPGASQVPSQFVVPAPSQIVAPVCSRTVTGRGASVGPASLATSPYRPGQPMLVGVGRGAPTNPGLTVASPHRVGAGGHDIQFFSPSGRGRAFISSNEYASGYIRPPPGFGIGDK